MGQPRLAAARVVLAGILPAALLLACGASAGGEHQNQGGAPAVADAGSGGSKAGSDSANSNAGSPSGGVSGGTSGASGAGGRFSRGGSGGSGGGAGQPGSSGANTGGAGDRPFPCGSTSCGASQYCVIPCCGGTAPACFPESGDGACPTGSHSGCSSNPGMCTSPAKCCQFDPCMPPPPYCSDTQPQICFPSPGSPGQARTCQMTCA